VSYLRVSRRAVLLIISLCVLMIPLVGIRMVSWVMLGRDRARRLRDRTSTMAFRQWARAACWIMGVRRRIRGAPPVPPFFLVTNHLGYLDIMVLAAQLPCVFVSKVEVRNWPVIGQLCAAVGTIFLDRENKRDLPATMRAIDAVLGSGRGVVLFPEGTSTKGSEVVRFRPSLLELPARSGRGVHYAALRYQTSSGSPPASETVCWWGDTPFFSHFREMLALPAIEAEVVFARETIEHSDRKILANDLREAVARSFVPVI
jgi:1-acyl-sn-glycerol-3-phosphate acyltransferase